MPGLIVRKNLEAHRVALSARFKGKLTGAPEVLSVMATSVPSTAAENIYDWFGSLPKFKKWVGEFIYSSAKEYDYRLKNDKFVAGFELDLDKYDDDTLGNYSLMVDGWGSAAGQLKEDMIVDALKNGHIRKCFDDKPFFATDHPVEYKDSKDKVVKDTAKNFLAGGGGADTVEPYYFVCLNQFIQPFLYQNRKDPKFFMDTDPEIIEKQQSIKMHAVARGAVGYSLWQLAYKSTKKLTKAVWEGIKQEMESRVDDQGDPLGITPTHVVFGTTNEADMKNLFKISVNNGTTNTEENAVQFIKSLRIK